jgi:hypothetical protein
MYIKMDLSGNLVWRYRQGLFVCLFVCLFEVRFQRSAFEFLKRQCIFWPIKQLSISPGGLYDVCYTAFLQEMKRNSKEMKVGFTVKHWYTWRLNIMRFEPVIAVNNKITIFLNEMPFILVNMIQHVWGNCYLRLQLLLLRRWRQQLALKWGYLFTSQ